jgi:hypothetical protein
MDLIDFDGPSNANRNRPENYTQTSPIPSDVVEHSQIYATSMLFMSLGAFAVNKFALRNVVGDSVALGGGLLLPFVLGDKTNRRFVCFLASVFGPGVDKSYDVTNRYSISKNQPRDQDMALTAFV